MSHFKLSDTPIDISSIREATLTPNSGGFTTFEGWVRNHHEGKNVNSLEYSAYQVLAEKEGNRIIAESLETYAIDHAYCTHRIGHLHMAPLAQPFGL